MNDISRWWIDFVLQFGPIYHCTRVHSVKHLINSSEQHARWWWHWQHVRTSSSSSRHLNNGREKSFLRISSRSHAPRIAWADSYVHEVEHETELRTANDVIKNVIKKMASKKRIIGACILQWPIYAPVIRNNAIRETPFASLIQLDSRFSSCSRLNRFKTYARRHIVSNGMKFANFARSCADPRQNFPLRATFMINVCCRLSEFYVHSLHKLIVI